MLAKQPGKKLQRAIDEINRRQEISQKKILLNSDNPQVTNPLEKKISNNYYNFSNSFSHTKKSYSTFSTACEAQHQFRCRERTNSSE